MDVPVRRANGKNRSSRPDRLTARTVAQTPLIRRAVIEESQGCSEAYAVWHCNADEFDMPGDRS